MNSARHILLSLVRATQSLTQKVIGRRGIGVREPLAYVLAFALVVVTVGVFLRFHIASMYQEEMGYWRARQAAVADDRAQWISDWLGERLADAELISSYPLVRAALRVHYEAGQPWGRPAARLPELTAVLDELAGLYIYSGVYVLDREARVVAQSNYATPLSPLLAETCRDAARTSGRRIDLLGDAPDRSLLSFSVPVFPESGPAATSRLPAQPLGIALVVVDAARTVFPLVTREGVLTRTGETLLVRREGGEVIFFSPLRHIPASSPNLRSPLSAAPLPARRAVEGLATFVEYNDFWGAPVLATTRYIPLTEWGIVQKINRAEALQSFYRMAIVEGLAAGLLIILLGGLLLFHRRDVLTRVLKREEAKFRALLESAPDAMVIADGEGRVVLLNALAETMFGFRRKEVIGLGLRMLLPEWAHAQPGESLPWDFSREAAQQVGKTIEMRGLRKDGSKFPLEARLGRIETAEGPAFSCAIRDITERQRAEADLLRYAQDLEAAKVAQEKHAEELARLVEELAEERDLLGTLMDNVPDYIYFKDRRSRFLRINRAHAKVFGLSDPGQAVGKTDFDFFTAEHAQQAYNDEQEVIITGKPMTAKEEKETWPGGRVTWVSTIKMPFRDANGAVIGTFGVSRDTTERKQAEEALGESEARYRRLFEQNLAGVFRGTVDGHVLDCNNAYARMLGYNSPQEILDLEKLDYFYDAQEGMTAIARLRREGSQPNLEIRLKRRDGSPISVLASVTLTEMGESRLLLVEGTLIDITMRKRAEEAQAFLASLVESSQDAIIGATLEALTASWNHGAEELYGYSAEEMIGNYVSVLYPPDHLDELAQLLEKVRQGKRIDCHESVRVRKDGTRVNVSLTISPVYDTTGRITGTVAIARDITERQRAEAEMAERHRLETLVAEVGVALTGAESLRQGLQQCAEILVRDINAALARIWTVNEADKVLELQASAGMYTHLDGGHARVPMGQFKVGRIAESGEPHLTNTVQQDSWVGDPEWARREGMVAFAGYPLKVEERVLGVVAAFARQPLTPATLQAFASVADNLAQFIERKRAEEALRENEERYRNLVESISDVVYAIDDAGVCTYMSPAVKNTLGYEPDELIGRHFLEIVDKEDRELVMRRFSELREGILRYTEYRLISKQGDIRWVRTLTNPIIGEEGFVGARGVLIDITERKRAEEASRESEERYRTLFENSPVGIYSTTADGRILVGNPALAQMLGCSSCEELASRNLNTPDFEPQYSRAQFTEKLEKDGRITGLESQWRRRDGSVIFVRENARAIQDEAGEILYYEGTAEDITERKRAEEALRVSHRFLEIANRHTEMTHLLKEFVAEVRNLTRCAAVGLRVLDAEGRIPYQAWEGFDPRFYESESPLSIRSDQCMCVNVITGTTDPKLSFYTEGGSFYMNGTTRFLAKVSEEEKGWTRNACNQFGYESVALVPIRSGDNILGLIHVADYQENRIPLETVEVLDGAAMQLGTAILRVRAEEALRASEERYRELFENASDLVFTTDLEGRLTSLNRVAEQTLAYSREEAAQMNLRQLADPRHWQRVEQSRERLLAGDSAVTLELEITAKDGRRVMLEVNPRLIYKDGKPVGMQGIGRDITGREEREMELRHAQKLESVGRLASGIAHEINTPIQFVGDNTRFVQDSFGGLQTLLSKYRELRDATASGAVSLDLLAAVRRVEKESDCAYVLEEIPKALTQTLDGVTRVATLVRAMKDFAHPESKEKIAADLNKALLSTLTVARNELKYVADVETDLGDLPPVVCNISDLNQVFLNLLVNAAHAISEVVKGSGEKGKIRVRTVAEDHTVLVTISDTGCGIPEGIRSKVFDPFFTTKEVGRGTGQGLAIARSVVVERHQGTLTFESEVGKGTTFYICLPLAPAECSRETKVL